jgi:hypothetical protein
MVAGAAAGRRGAPAASVRPPFRPPWEARASRRPTTARQTMIWGGALKNSGNRHTSRGRSAVAAETPEAPRKGVTLRRA